MFFQFGRLILLYDICGSAAKKGFKSFARSHGRKKKENQLKTGFVFDSIASYMCFVSLSFNCRSMVRNEESF